MVAITCPVCERTSWNPNDVEEGYCGFCHNWTYGKVSTGEGVFDWHYYHRTSIPALGHVGRPVVDGVMAGHRYPPKGSNRWSTRDRLMIFGSLAALGIIVVGSVGFVLSIVLTPWSQR